MPFAGGLFAVGFVASLMLGGLTLYLFLSRRISIRQFVFWEGLLLGLLILAVFPGLIDWLASLINVGVRGLFVLAMGLLGVYIIVYNLSVRQHKHEKQVQHLSQEVALLRYQLEYRSEVQDESSGNNNDL